MGGKNTSKVRGIDQTTSAKMHIYTPRLHMTLAPLAGNAS